MLQAVLRLGLQHLAGQLLVLLLRSCQLRCLPLMLLLCRGQPGLQQGRAAVMTTQHN